ncbi:hypothetical protein AB4Y67_18910 [Arthrobacter sp. YAF17]|uniref:hypothetical protein n=1 Tax=Arthrobacter sp. YAF17 TaxID=3233077 RepID=UPI003F933EB0
MSGVSRPTVVLGLAALGLSVMTIIGLPAPLQAVAAIAVLILLPGQALTRLIPVTDLALVVLLVLALGLATLTAVSTTMFYLGGVVAVMWGMYVLLFVPRVLGLLA